MKFTRNLMLYRFNSNWSNSLWQSVDWTKACVPLCFHADKNGISLRLYCDETTEPLIIDVYEIGMDGQRCVLYFKFSNTFSGFPPPLKLNSTKKMSRNRSKGLKRKEVRQVVINPSIPSIMIAKHFTTAGTILMNCCLMNQIQLRKVYGRSDWHVISTFFFHWASQVVNRFSETPNIN